MALPGAAAAHGVAFTTRTSAQLEDGTAGAPNTTRVRTCDAVMRFDGVAEGRDRVNRPRTSPLLASATP